METFEIFFCNFKISRLVIFSGLKGQALGVEMIDIPTMKEFQKVIPSHCFNCKTITSLRYLFQSIIIQFFVVAIGLTIPIKHQMLPIWVLYAFISGMNVDMEHFLKTEL